MSQLADSIPKIIYSTRNPPVCETLALVIAATSLGAELAWAMGTPPKFKNRATSREDGMVLLPTWLERSRLVTEVVRTEAITIATTAHTSQNIQPLLWQRVGGAMADVAGQE